MVAQPRRRPQDRPTVAVVGAGYVGERLVHCLAARGYRVLAAARRPPAPRRSGPGRIVPVALDLDTGAGLGALRAADAVIALHPPPREGERDPRTARLLAALDPARLRRLVYLSTTGVYGDRGGAWLPETAPPAPRTLRGRRRADAEARVRAFGARSGVCVPIVRAAGIYGPGRLGEDRVRSGQALRVAWPETRFAALIHVADLVALLERALHFGGCGRIYHGCDGRAHEQGALPEATARALGRSPPPPVSPEEARATFSAVRLSFLEESRRCAHERTRRELGWQPQRTDLAAAVHADLDRPDEPGAGI